MQPSPSVGSVLRKTSERLTLKFLLKLSQRTIRPTYFFARLDSASMLGVKEGRLDNDPGSLIAYMLDCNF